MYFERVLSIATISVLLAVPTTAAPVFEPRGKPVIAPQAESRRRAVRMDEVSIWLRTNGIEMTSTDSVESIDDIARIADWAAGASIVALGDGSHGTHEYYTMKKQLTRLLLERGGFRAIAFEGSWTEFMLINDYVHGDDTVNPRAILAALARIGYWFWNVEEMLDFIEWARQYNTGKPAEDQLEILGFDVLSSKTSSDEVLAFLGRVDPAARSIAATAYACLQTVCAPQYRQVRESIEQRLNDYEKLESRRNVLRAIQNARVLEQYMTRGSATEYNNIRDERMASNAQWIQSTWLDDGNLILWAHMLHTGLLPFTLSPTEIVQSMGIFLRQAYGAQYRTVGSCTLDGTFMSFDSRQGRGARPVSLSTLSGDYIELYFARSAIHTLFIPLNGDDLPAWLAAPRYLRVAGGTIEWEPPIHTPISNLFDAIIFVDHTTATVPLVP